MQETLVRLKSDSQKAQMTIVLPSLAFLQSKSERKSAGDNMDFHFLPAFLFCLMWECRCWVDIWCVIASVLVVWCDWSCYDIWKLSSVHPYSTHWFISIPSPLAVLNFPCTNLLLCKLFSVLKAFLNHTDMVKSLVISQVIRMIGNIYSPTKLLKHSEFPKW